MDAKRRGGRRRALGLGLVLAAGLAGGAAAAESCPPIAGAAASVADIIDGDTLRLGDGRVVHIAGIEAPKASAGDAAARKALADAARRALQHLVGDGAVTVAAGAGKPDRYGRVHAALATPAGPVAEALLAGGFARVRLFPGETVCLAGLLAAERAGRAARLGLWASPDFAVRRANDPSLGGRSGLYELVEGRVAAVGHGRSMIFLDFGRDYRRDFSIMVPAALAGRLAVPADALKGRRVLVRGVIEESGGPAIRLGDPAELELMDGDGGGDGQG